MARRLRDWDADIRFSVSATTRAARPNEVDGRDYHFVDETRFKELVHNREMLEHAHVFGHFYGSPLAPVLEAIEAGHDVLFDIDWQGAQQIQKSPLASNVLSVFLLPPSINELRRRLEDRGQDSKDVVSKRMNRSWDEISHWDGYDYVLVNDDLDATESRLRTIVAAERMRASQQPALVDHVRLLQSEFEARE